MKDDPAIEAIRKVRHEISAAVGHDPQKLVAYLREFQERHRERLAVAIAGGRAETYDTTMIIIRFPDAAVERRALGFLAGRFSFKSWDSGETMVPEQALAALAVEGISFFAEGPATYDQLATTVRNPPAATVQ